MQELLRTNDIVYISFARAALRSAGIESFVLDETQSVMDGSNGVIPRRVMVSDAHLVDAQEILRVLAKEIDGEGEGEGG